MPQDKIVKKDRDGFHGAIYRPESHGKLTDEKLKKVKQKGYKEYSQDEYEKKLEAFKGKRSKQIDRRADEVASKKKEKATRTGLLAGGTAGTLGAIAGKGRAGMIAGAIIPTAIGTGLGYAVGKNKEQKIKDRADKIKKYINQDIDISGEGRRYFYKESEAKSKSQKRLMSMAHGVKKGDLDPQELNPSLRKKVMEIADSMSKEQIEDYSRTPSKGLPEKTASSAYHLERIKRLAKIFPKETKKVVNYSKKNNDTRGLLSQVSKLEEKAVRSGKAEIVNHKALGKPLLQKKASTAEDFADGAVFSGLGSMALTGLFNAPRIKHPGYWKSVAQAGAGGAVLGGGLSAALGSGDSPAEKTTMVNGQEVKLASMDKTADFVINEGKDAKMTSIGLFIGTDKNHKQKSQEIHKLMEQEGSLLKARKKYQEKHPDDFTTVVAKKESPPSKLKFWKKDDYKNKINNPKLYISVGRAGGPSQQEFYKDVSERRPYDKKFTKKFKKKSKDNKMEKKAQPKNQKSLKDMNEREKMRVLQKHVQQHNSRVQNSIDSRNSAVNKKLVEETGKWSGIGAIGGGALGAGAAKLLKKGPVKGGLAGAAAGAVGLGGLALSDLYPKAQKYKINDQQEAAIMKGLNKRHVQAAEQLQKNGSENKLKSEADVQELL